MNIKPKKYLGQNFLINHGIIEKIIRAGELTKNDVVLEIGPGSGVLTQALAEKAGKVIAIEKDVRLISELKNRFKNFENIEIIEGDILKVSSEDYNLKAESYKLIGNIPYYITSHLLRKVLSSPGSGWPKPELIILMVQKEVAQRIVAKPPDMSLLALSVQLYSNPKIVSYVSKGSFRPIPKVDSAILKIEPKEDVDHGLIEKALVLAKKAFASKRKQLKNTLGKKILEKSNIESKKRPEELELDSWKKLVGSLDSET